VGWEGADFPFKVNKLTNIERGYYWSVWWSERSLYTLTQHVCGQSRPTEADRRHFHWDCITEPQKHGDRLLEIFII